MSVQLSNNMLHREIEQCLIWKIVAQVAATGYVAAVPATKVLSDISFTILVIPLC